MPRYWNGSLGRTERIIESINQVPLISEDLINAFPRLILHSDAHFEGDDFDRDFAGSP